MTDIGSLNQAMPGIEAQDSAEAAAAPRYRRRKWIVDIRLQGRYMFQMTAMAILFGGVSAYAASTYYASGADAWLSSSDPVNRMFFYLWAQLAALVALLVPLTSIFLSHRFAGPAFRIGRATDDVIQGDLSTRIHLRSKDHLVPLADGFNRMLDHLEAQKNTRLDRDHALRGSIRQALEKMSSEDSSEFPEALRLLEEVESKIV